MQDDFKTITDINLFTCEREVLVESRLSDNAVTAIRKWVIFFRHGKPMTFDVNVAQIIYVRHCLVQTGRIEVRKNPFRRCRFDFFSPATAEFFVDEGKIDFIEIKMADGTTFDVETSTSPSWLKEIVSGPKTSN